MNKKRERENWEEKKKELNYNSNIEVNSLNYNSNIEVSHYLLNRILKRKLKFKGILKTETKI